MEPVQDGHSKRRKQTSAKVNVTISLIFHALTFAAGAYWAAHEGVLGKKLQELSVILVPKEKKPDEKKAEPKVEQVKKIDQPKAVEQAKAAPAAAKAVAPPPPAADRTAAAPPPAGLPSFSFSDRAPAAL